MSFEKNIFEGRTQLYDDECAINAREYQNMSIHEYRLWNDYNYACNSEGEKKLQQFSTTHPNLHYRNGVGMTTSCHVEKDSDLRLNAKITSEKARNQLFHRFYQNNPYLGKGKTVPNVESRLMQSEDTSKLKVCDRIAEKDFDRFIPLVQCVKDTVQNADTVVYPWTNGGDNSRLLMRDAQTLKECGWEKVDKVWTRSQ
jgi:hypothetical protein